MCAVWLQHRCRSDACAPKDNHAVRAKGAQRNTHTPGQMGRNQKTNERPSEQEKTCSISSFCELRTESGTITSTCTKNMYFYYTDFFFLIIFFLFYFISFIDLIFSYFLMKDCVRLSFILWVLNTNEYSFLEKSYGPVTVRANWIGEERKQKNK